MKAYELKWYAGSGFGFSSILLFLVAGSSPRQVKII
jgi:hypothetical protein